MAEIEFTIDTETGNCETKINGIQGPACEKTASQLKQVSNANRSENSRAQCQIDDKAKVGSIIKNWSVLEPMRTRNRRGIAGIEGNCDSLARDPESCKPELCKASRKAKISAVLQARSTERTVPNQLFRRLYRLYHNSVVDGPGRRSVIKPRMPSAVEYST